MTPVINQNTITQHSASNVSKTSPSREGLTDGVEENQVSWVDGRRIVQLDLLAEGLGTYCDKDCALLDLRNIIDEVRYGFASVLWVKCGECGNLNSVRTSKSHRAEGSKRVECQSTM